jgi:hypothetical protein
MRRLRHATAKQENDYWPGYVDALVNIVINLVFLSGLMVVVFAVQNSILLPIKRQSQALLDDPTVKMLQGMEALASQYDALGLDKEQLFKSSGASAQRAREVTASGIKPHTIHVTGPNQTDTVPSSSVDLRMREQRGQNQMVIAFGASAFELSPNTLKVFQTLWMNHAHKLVQPLNVQATVPEGDVASQRIAFLRILAVRNQLIAMGLPPHAIQTLIQPSRNPSPQEVQEITVSSSTQ